MSDPTRPDPSRSDPSRPDPFRSDRSRLAVAPSMLVDAGHRLSALTGSLELTATHFREPRPGPPLGNSACAMAYLGAHQQLAGVVTLAVAQGRALAGSLTAAAALYEVLDGGGR
jgi:hypothetical protein